MKVVCDCGEEMTCVDHNPGCDPENPSNCVLFECECGAGLSGEHRLGKEESDDEDSQEDD